MKGKQQLLDDISTLSEMRRKIHEIPNGNKAKIEYGKMIRTGHTNNNNNEDEIAAHKMLDLDDFEDIFWMQRSNPKSEMNEKEEQKSVEKKSNEENNEPTTWKVCSNWSPLQPLGICPFGNNKLELPETLDNLPLATYLDDSSENNNNNNQNNNNAKLNWTDLRPLKRRRISDTNIEDSQQDIKLLLPMSEFRKQK